MQRRFVSAFFLLVSLLSIPVVAGDSTTVVRLFAFGDVNLGRIVGQSLLAGDTLYPFRNMQNILKQGDIVFANLESQLSDQGGETQHPKYNLIFTGPPVGGEALARGGITIVSTANNHAYDYKFRALLETLKNLDSSGVYHVGTCADTTKVYDPEIIKRKGITFAFFAVTALMNDKSSEWKPYVAWADTTKLLPQIRRIRNSVDVLIVSYHGGEEYIDQPTKKVRKFFKYLTEAGVDIIIGHHPHVPQGIEADHNTWKVFSLGNFVFRQPQKKWTQKSYGMCWSFSKNNNSVEIDSVSIIPIRAGLQPSVIQPGSAEQSEVFNRVKRLSNVTVPWKKDKGE